MASENHIYKFSNAGGFKSLTRYSDMLAGNTTWNPWAPAGAYDALASVVVPSGGLSQITFAGIPSDYKHLQIRASVQTNRATYGTDNLLMKINSATGYGNHGLYGDGSGAYSTGAANATAMNIGGVLTGVAGGFAGVIIDVLDYNSTSKNKTVKALSGADHNGTIAGFGGTAYFASGVYLSATALTSVSFTPNTGTLFNQYSSFALYGIK